MNEILKEEDLYNPIKEYFELQGYKVNGEVKDCDLVAIKDETIIIVELKKNLTVALLAQAVKRQKTADFVYAAVPKPKNMKYSSKWRDICHLLRRLELGLIMVDFKKNKTFVDIVQEPKAFDMEKSKRVNKGKRTAIIKETQGRYMDLNKGGSRGKKLVTAYREAAIYIACCLSKYGELTPKKLRNMGSDEKKTLSILYNDVYGWFYKAGRGLYGISEKGKKELEDFKDLTGYFFSIIK
ncbi:hypothetical protein IAI10_18010 [Clostridium sp. 19966]|uniref:DUF2161 family putative PD-(D/E)XK-type phosphodiesterase n=1 Tax=Clostridium sp. 19966 TaxID=2768166 RepID=UPI0028DDEF87|nr:DUF2161 family putative PD-(D/E)XK-type phosphodiesterase [Clostridium sp. 19966]MDT8718563.1 hypothetical protein [Clostridium sp. 19966]